MRSFKFNGLDEIDLTKIIDNKKNAYLKVALESLEREIIDEELYKHIRKIFLDSFNEFVRSVLRLFLGDIEKK